MSNNIIQFNEGVMKYELKEFEGGQDRVNLDSKKIWGKIP